MESEDDDELYLRTFCNAARCNIINERPMYEKSMTSISDMWDAIDSNTQYHTQEYTLVTLEMDVRRMKMIGGELDKLRTLHDRYSEALYRETRQNRKKAAWKTFLNENPAIKEQYDEIMTLAKLAGYLVDN